jgi:protein FrlC
LNVHGVVRIYPRRHLQAYSGIWPAIGQKEKNEFISSVISSDPALGHVLEPLFLRSGGMKISIASGVYLNFPLREAIQRVADAGYDGIDIWSGRPHVYRQDFTSKQLSNLRSLIQEQGLMVSSFMPAFYRYPYDLGSLNDIVRQDSIAYMKECIDNAATLASPIVLIVPKRAIYGHSIEDAWGKLTESIDEVCRYAQQYDLMMGLEPANKYVTDLVNSAEDALRMIDALGHDNLGAVIDTGHVHLSNETAQDAIEKLGKRLLQVHVNDNDGQQQQNLVPGDGTFDFTGLIEALRQVRFEGFLSAELGFQYTIDPDPAVQLTAQRLREML